MLSKEDIILVENLQKKGLLENNLDLTNEDILYSKVAKLAADAILSNVPLDNNLSKDGVSIFTAKDFED